MAVELLAPAGSWEAMEAAIGAGADAVYLGGTSFGARAYAGNFEEEDLCRAIDYVHLRSRRLYVTVNTLLKNREIPEQLDSFLLPLYRCGLDGAIVQDVGVLAYIRKRFPDLPVHISTQMTVTGPAGACFLEKQGAARVVLARELSLSELREVREKTSLQMEVFVHGALCYSYSGQCLFSSMLGGRSGNRGRCAQPCRLTYEAGRKKACLLSLKDLCALELLPELVAAGIDSLKIEGRMKQPEYVAGVVSVYRRYLDECENGKPRSQWDEKKLKKDREFLRELFHRGGFSKGYLVQEPGPTMIALENHKKTGKAGQGKIRKRKEKIKGNLILSSGSHAILELSANDCDVMVTGDIPQKAQKRPTSRERITEQMCKTGDSPFDFEDFSLEMEEGLFLPVSQINELRRRGLEALGERILRPYRRRTPDSTVPSRRIGKSPVTKEPEVVIAVSCESWEQWQVLEKMEGLEELYLSLPLYEKLDREMGKGYFQGLSKRRKWFLALPHVVRKGHGDKLSQICARALSEGCMGFLVRNLESFGILAERGWAGMCHLDAGMYTYNDRAVDFWRGQDIAADMVPLELNQNEISHRDNSISYMMVYGYIPLMISAQCLQKNLRQCDKEGRCLYVRDRYQKEFPVQCYCDFCYNILYNSLPYGLLEYKERLVRMGLYRFFLSFTLEDPKRTRKVVDAFLQAYRKENVRGDFSFTKGHMRRGVE